MERSQTCSTTPFALYRASLVPLLSRYPCARLQAEGPDVRESRCARMGGPHLPLKESASLSCSTTPSSTSQSSSAALDLRFLPPRAGLDTGSGSKASSESFPLPSPSESDSKYAGLLRAARYDKTRGGRTMVSRNAHVCGCKSRPTHALGGSNNIFHLLV